MIKSRQDEEDTDRNKGFSLSDHTVVRHDFILVYTLFSSSTTWLPEQHVCVCVRVRVWVARAVRFGLLLAYVVYVF